MGKSGVTLSFGSLISAYRKLQSGLMVQVRRLASKISQATPGSFILLQFQMSQVAQIGESISNLIAQVNTVISHTINNQQK
jgi:hypothetical protein